MSATGDKMDLDEPRGKHLFCFGFGYTASFLAAHLTPLGWTVSGTTTSAAKRRFLSDNGIASWIFDRQHEVPDPRRLLEDVTHVLLCVPPDAAGDAVFDLHGDDIADMGHLEWLGYLSTTAVYGNHDGQAVDESTPPEPTSRRGSLRLKAEEQWRWLHASYGVPLHIFRLSGIYGPGRSAVETVRSGLARRIDKPGHVFNRIHIDDIVQTLMASIRRPAPGNIYNLADDRPSPSHEVVALACELTGTPPPPLVPFDRTDMAPMVRSFYKDNKRVKNDKIKSELGVRLIHPDYRTGLRACLDVEHETLELLKLAGGAGDNE